MKRIEETLTLALKGAILSLFNQEPTNNLVQIQHTRKDFEGDFTVVTFPLIRFSKQSPEKTGQLIGDYLVGLLEEVESFNVVKGFLNLVITETYWFNFLQHLSTQSNWGISEPGSKGMCMVEYSSPNTNKPLHLGHLRNNFLGYSVAKILEANGHETVKVQIINDRGIHICKSMVAWQKFGQGETPTSSGMKGDKLVGKYYVAFDKAYKAEMKSLVEGGMTEDEAKTKAPLMLEAQEMLLKWEEKDTEVYSLWETMNSWVYTGFEHTLYRDGR